MISQTGVDLSIIRPTFVIGKTIDLYIILCHRANRLLTPAERLFLRTEKNNSSHKLWDIRLLVIPQVQRNPSSTQLLVVIRSIVCFDIGKGTPVKKMERAFFREQASISAFLQRVQAIVKSFRW